MFDDLAGDELAADRASVAAAGLDAAQVRATERLLDGPGAGVGDARAVWRLLVDRATDDPAWERLAPFEVRWALLVLRLVDGALNQVAAVADARRRGGTWAAIGDALGVTAASAHTRFAAKI